MKKTEGFQKRAKPDSWRDVRLARISYTDRGATCNCGWSYSKAIRESVLETAIERHLTKRHGGMGIRF